MPLKRHRLALVGGGHRGIGMALNMLQDPARAELVAVAEPRADRQADCRRALPVPPDQYYRDHQELLKHAGDLRLDAAILATTVATHCEVACACIEAGLAIFLEKPMARTIEEAGQIVAVAEHTRVPAQVGFNLRYTPFCEELHRIVTSGTIGTAVAINWTEAISLRHWTECYCRNRAYAHSSAIGSWLLEKSCHDMDQFSWLLGKRCERVASFGSRSFFVPRPDIPKRCSDKCPICEDCLFVRVSEAKGMSAWLTHEELEACVYHVNSDLLDHQTVILEYDDGATVSFNLVPNVPRDNRTMTVYGTEGMISGDLEDNRISVHSLRSGTETTVRPRKIEGGHDGSDERTALAFLDYLDDPANRPKTGVREGFEAVLLACAADTAAKEHRVVELGALRSTG